MAETELNYEADLTPAITSLNSLASDTTAGLLVACSAAIDFTSGEQYLDAIPYVTVSYPNSAPTVSFLTAYYAAYDGNAWTDDGYADAPDGTDQTITIGLPTSLAYAGTIAITQNRITICRLQSVGTVFGFPPKKVCVVVHNGTGQTLNSSGHGLRVAVVTAVTA